MPSQPSRRDVADQNGLLLQRQECFRAAADAVTEAFITFAEVQSVALFGSVARPLAPEVPRFQPYRRLRIELFHECKDVDLAVWLTDLSKLRDLGRARNQVVSLVTGVSGSGVAHHQVDIFLFEVLTGTYLGRLCSFASCPKDKPECRIPRCGEVPFLRQHREFVLARDALTNAVILYDRAKGVHFLASNLPGQLL